MKRILTKIEHIFIGWWLLISSNKKANQLNAIRKPICQGCPFRDKFLNVCKDCHCYLPVKRRVDEAECPQSKW